MVHELCNVNSTKVVVLKVFNKSFNEEILYVWQTPNNHHVKH